jgi:hypothetical protein
MIHSRHPGESRDLRSENRSGSPRGPGFRRGDGYFPNLAGTMA